MLPSIESYSREIYTFLDEATASTHPHHKHVPPDIKHYRVPAPNLSFHHPNLPVLVEEIECDVLQQPEA